MSCWAVITLNALGLCKQRLAPVLAPQQREQLVRLMLEDVLTALRAASCIDQIAVISPQPLSLGSDIHWLADPGGGLNAAAAQAADYLTAQGIEELLLLHADVPLIDAAEVDQFVAAGRASGIALAADRGGCGTNAIFLAQPHNYQFGFGAHSLQRHQNEAISHRLLPALLVLPGMSFDIDTPSDLELLARLADQRYSFIQGNTRRSAWPNLQFG